MSGEDPKRRISPGSGSTSPGRPNRQDKWNRPDFSAEEMQYDPDEWLIPSQDGKGHGKSLTLRIPTGLARDIEILLSAKKFPYQSPSDLLRHAVLRHVRWLEGLEPNIPIQFLTAMHLIQDLHTDDIYKMEMEQSLYLLEQAVQGCLNRGDRSEALRLIARARAHLERAQDSPAKRRAMGYFREKFSGMLSGGTGVPGDNVVELTPIRSLIPESKRITGQIFDPEIVSDGVEGEDA